MLQILHIDADQVPGLIARAPHVRQRSPDDLPKQGNLIGCRMWSCRPFRCTEDTVDQADRRSLRPTLPSLLILRHLIFP